MRLDMQLIHLNLPLLPWRFHERLLDLLTMDSRLLVPVPHRAFVHAKGADNGHRRTPIGQERDRPEILLAIMMQSIQGRPPTGSEGPATDHAAIPLLPLTMHANIPVFDLPSCRTLQIRAKYPRRD